MDKYLILFGGLLYYNRNSEASARPEEVVDGAFDTYEEALERKNLWDGYAKHRCSFEVVKYVEES